ncbi:hypothetical protein BCV70DRAFT_231587 [Testicularia cyperi]|uniref:Uncharacterized protein n=1 Tax=Testicularia cyperi TaxID=1882483 RepID=A0A317XRS0_9BASI|nr:hypothetical protein BCV70DRAFT_231587 [Testicularia cyperi]
MPRTTDYLSGVELLQKFDPSKPNCPDPGTFWVMIEVFCTIKAKGDEPDDRQKTKVLEACLDGPASDWFRTLPFLVRRSSYIICPLFFAKFRDKARVGELTVWRYIAFEVHIDRPLSYDDLKAEAWSEWLNRTYDLAKEAIDNCPALSRYMAFRLWGVVPDWLLLHTCICPNHSPMEILDVLRAVPHSELLDPWFDGVCLHFHVCTARLTAEVLVEQVDLVLFKSVTKLGPGGYLTKRADFRSDRAMQDSHGLVAPAARIMEWWKALSQQSDRILPAALAKNIIMSTPNESFRDFPEEFDPSKPECIKTTDFIKKVEAFLAQTGVVDDAQKARMLRILLHGVADVWAQCLPLDESISYEKLVSRLKEQFPDSKMPGPTKVGRWRAFVMLTMVARHQCYNDQFDFWKDWADQAAVAADRVLQDHPTMASVLADIVWNALPGPLNELSGPDQPTPRDVLEPCQSISKYRFDRLFAQHRAKAMENLTEFFDAMARDAPEKSTTFHRGQKFVKTTINKKR